MRAYDQNIVALLNERCGEAIYSVTLGGFDFQVSFGGIRRLQTMTGAVFFLRGRTYEWSHGPSALPVWLLIDQIPLRFELPDRLILRMHLASGDYVDFFTDESRYEAAIVEFDPSVNGLAMEVF